jgi:hypothetical protein
MSGSPEGSSHDRRRFLKLVGLAGMTSAISSTLLGWTGVRAANAPPRGTSPSATASKATADTAKAAAQAPEVSADARALAGVVQRRYGKYLSAKQLESVTQELDYYLQAGKRLREARLENGDEPDFTFRAS